MDIANIYNLSDDEFKKYKDPFPDDEVRPEMKEFAEKFKTELMSFPTPYVLAFEGGYGVGKTFFVTRFCQYLNNESIKAIYLNLWESDYIAEPFSIIAAEILEKLQPTLENQADNLKESVISATKNIAKFFNKNLDGLLPDISAYKKDLRLFKEKLKELIGEQKLVLIVDELDRCKPDYAVKALEIIKHFFDIEGLIVILPTKMDTLNRIFEAYYGHPHIDNLAFDNAQKHGECYAQKFINNWRPLNAVSERDYLFIVERILNDGIFKDYNYIKNMEKTWGTQPYYDAAPPFKKYMAEIFSQSKASIRKTQDILIEVKLLINRYHEDIWNNKAKYFPEHIIYRWLNRKKLLSNIAQPHALGYSMISLKEQEKIFDALVDKIS